MDAKIDVDKRLRTEYISPVKNKHAVAMGKLGGKTKGKTKSRGTSAHYAALAKLSWAKRKRLEKSK